ncbi:MAG TPA: GH116 family glycosyl hydrolase [Steroidobacteraceae bacterium]|nr:GH116 family glycosyl hydrolase [Steroidobacteraceae bacterium]
MKKPVWAGLLPFVSLAFAITFDLRAAQLPFDATVTSPRITHDYAAPALAGISNQGRTGHQPYVTAGDRAYLIGTQDGNFPDMGHHVPGEMGGLWLPPIKLIDGFQARVADLETGKETLLSKSREMVAHPYGNLFRYGRVLQDLDVDRFQFSPDHQQGVIIQYRFRNASNRTRRLRFRWSVKTDLRPGWDPDRLAVRDGHDAVVWRPDKGIFIARDTYNTWFCVWGAPLPSAEARRIKHPDPILTKGRGVTAASSYTVMVRPHATSVLTLIVSGSTSSEADAVGAYDRLAKEQASLLAEKVTQYRSVIDRAQIRIPDRRLQEVYNWSRINVEWLVRDVPGIGRGVSGGFMEYPWWFGTETYTLQALTATGDFELVEQTLRLLRDRSYEANGNGRIAHEITTDGQVTNRGNTQETAQFVMTVGKVFQWTGDRDFAREMYPAVKRSIDWLLGTMDQNKDRFPEGYGIMEVLGLNSEVVDVAVYTQQALEAAARIAEALHDEDREDRYRKVALDLKQRINQRFWIERDGTYADIYGSRSQAVSAVEGAIKQIELKGADRLTREDQERIAYYERVKARYAAMPEGERAWIINKNWVIATPMETGIAPRGRALRLLDQIRREDSGEYGPYLSAVERQAMMTISTGVQAVAEANYGRTDEALWYMDRIAQTFNRVSPGSMSEMMPDRGCFTIAWTSYGIVLPLVEHVFGIQPDAADKTIVFQPHLPTGWEDISIRDLPVGSNLISFSRARSGNRVSYEIDARRSGWSFILRERAASGARYFLNGNPIRPASSGILMHGTKNRVLVIAAP